MADLAKRLSGPALLLTTTQVLYTVPTGMQTIVRNIHLANVTTDSVTFNVAIGSAGTTTNCLYYRFYCPGAGAVDWSGFLVLNAGETLQALSATASAVTLTVSGIEVTL